MFVTNRHAFWTAGRRLIPAGSILDADHPMARYHKDQFEPLRPTIEVEQATRAPGERSTARRPEPAPSYLNADPPPSKVESKAVWVDYATRQGVDVDGLTKAQIVELFDG